MSCLVSLGESTRIAGPAALSAGPHSVAVSYEPSLTGAARFCLQVDGGWWRTLVMAGGHVPRPVHGRAPGCSSAATSGLPFNDDYQPPFPCTAALRRLVIRSGQPADPRSTEERVDLAARSD